MTDWPTCPACNARRITRCPICATAGSDFAPADMDVPPLLGLEDPASASGCSCGSGGCGPELDGPEHETTADCQAVDDQPPAMLMCSTCDEPFVPTYPSRCEWCGHTFDDGWDDESLPAPVDSINGRTVAVMLILAVFLIAMAAYLAWLL